MGTVEGGARSRSGTQSRDCPERRRAPPARHGVAVGRAVDAMQTIGLNTVDVLVLPRIVGLVTR